MIRIDRICNEEEIHQYKLDVSPSMHNDLINFFNSLNFSSDELDKLDVLFGELDGEYFFVKDNEMKVHFFVAKYYVNMVIDSKKSQKELTEIMKKFFIFPYKK
jgi:hypothetical protein